MVKLIDDCHGYEGTEVEVKLYPNNVTLVVPSLASDETDGVPVAIEQHDGKLRLLIYVNKDGEFQQYPQVIYLT